MKICFITFVLLVVFCSALYPRDLEERQVVIDKNAANKTYTSILVQPFTMWHIFSGEDLDYDLDPSSYTTYQGSFWHKYGFKLGVSLDVDNNFVGKFYRLAGFLGFKRFFVRASTSTVSGSVTWTGDPIPGYDSVKHFESRFTTIELLYDFYFPLDEQTVLYSDGVPIYGGVGKTGWGRGSYIGLLYNSWELPVGIEVKSGHQKDTPKGFYDTVKFHNYGFNFGFDNLDGWFLYGAKNESKYTRGFSPWLSSYFYFWMGWADIAGTTVELLQDVNPGLEITKNDPLITFGMQFDAILGLCYIGWIRNVQCGISLGYTFSAAICGGPFLEEDYFYKRQKEGVISTGYSYIRHGAGLKIGIAF